MRQQAEKSDVALRDQQEAARLVQQELQQRLQASQRQLLELEALRAQMEAKDEVQEGLVREKEELASRLGVAEHQLAVLKAGAGLEVDGEEGGQGGGVVAEHLRKLGSENDALREQ